MENARQPSQRGGQAAYPNDGWGGGQGGGALPVAAANDSWRPDRRCAQAGSGGGAKAAAPLIAISTDDFPF